MMYITIMTIKLSKYNEYAIFQFLIIPANIFATLNSFEHDLNNMSHQPLRHFILCDHTIDLPNGIILEKEQLS